MNKPSGIEEWLTTDQEINMVHTLMRENEKKMLSMLMTSKEQRLQQRWFYEENPLKKTLLQPLIQ